MSDGRESQQELSGEFARLQQQQQRRLERLRELKMQQQQPQATATSQAFGGVDDNLGLATGPASRGARSEVPGSSPAAPAAEALELRDRVRALTDENGRLMKLVSEREFEIQRLQRAKDRLAMGPGEAQPETSAGAASVKIVELSKRIRELTAELEREKTRGAQAARRCQELERVAAATAPVSAPAKLAAAEATEATPAQEAARERKELRERLRVSDARLTELREQVQTLTRDLSIAKKALADEVGDCGVTPAQILGGQAAGWRGRQQQLLMLQARVRDLEQQLRARAAESASQPTTGATSLGYDVFSSTSASSTHRGGGGLGGGGGGSGGSGGKELQRIQRDRREAAERAEKELRDLREEREKLQERVEGAKARAKTLSTENKSLKSQLQTLLDKGRHDDELIASLMRQQERARTLLAEAVDARSALERVAHGETARMAVQRDQEVRVIDRLKEIVAEKEAQIRRLQASGGSVSSVEVGGGPPVPLMPVPMPLSQKVERAVSARPRTASSSGNGGGGGGSGLDSAAAAIEAAAAAAELRALLSACEVERDRLRELAGVQETRYQHLLDREARSSAQLQATVRRMALLERQLERSGGVGGGGGRAKGPQAAAPSVAMDMVPTDSELSALLSDDLPVSRDSVDRLRDALSSCHEEAASLRRALQSALHSKNEDMKMLTDIVAQTREQFLSAMRAFKGSQQKQQQ